MTFWLWVSLFEGEEGITTPKMSPEAVQGTWPYRCQGWPVRGLVVNDFTLAGEASPTLAGRWSELVSAGISQYLLFFSLSGSEPAGLEMTSCGMSPTEFGGRHRSLRGEIASEKWVCPREVFKDLAGPLPCPGLQTREAWPSPRLDRQTWALRGARGGRSGLFSGGHRGRRRAGMGGGTALENLERGRPLECPAPWPLPL